MTCAYYLELRNGEPVRRLEIVEWNRDSVRMIEKCAKRASSKTLRAIAELIVVTINIIIYFTIQNN